MVFRSKTEAYSYALFLVTNMMRALTAQDKDKQHDLRQTMDNCLLTIQKAQENHVQDPTVIYDSLQSIAIHPTLPQTHRQSIQALQKMILSSDYQQTAEEKFRNPLARRIESELAILLLQEPTHAMMASVKRVSDELLKLLPIIDRDNFLSLLKEEEHVIALGSFKKRPRMWQIQRILENNDPQKLPEIMHIHFKIAVGFMRKMPITNAPERCPSPNLERIIKTRWPFLHPQDFFTQKIKLPTQEGFIYRSYICDELLYKSPLYTAPGNRGRSISPFEEKETQQMGLMLDDQQEFATQFPSHSSSWAADCKCQEADLTSAYVLDLIENDAVYVSGPSGMTSVLLCQMEVVANLENEALKKNYLSAMLAYIVGGGFHSIHEVLAPAQYGLGLIPGYPVRVPQLGTIAPPPQYNHFFLQQEGIDPEFSERHQRAWQNYLTFYANHYVPTYLQDLPSKLIAIIHEPHQECATEEKEPKDTPVHADLSSISMRQIVSTDNKAWPTKIILSEPVKVLIQAKIDEGITGDLFLQKMLARKNYCNFYKPVSNYAFFTKRMYCSQALQHQLPQLHTMDDLKKALHAILAKNSAHTTIADLAIILSRPGSDSRIQEIPNHTDESAPLTLS